MIVYQANEQKKKKEIRKSEEENERKREKGTTKYLETEKTNSTAYKASTL